MIKHILLSLCVLFLFSCYDDPLSKEKSESSEIIWKGILSTAPVKPEENWVYYDTELKKSLIFNGFVWDTMTINGIDGVSLKWLGSHSSPPTENALPNSVYFNSTDKISYIFNGASWDTLSSSGEAGLSIEWKGTLAKEPQNPKLHWIYHNSTTNQTLIFNGLEWEPFTSPGLDGLSVNWLGSHAEHPDNPEVNSAYYNQIKNCSYIFDGIGWMILAKDGPQGEEGNSIVWLGLMLNPPSIAEVNWTYCSLIDGNSYIYDGTEWKIFAHKGKDGLSIMWQGEYPEAPLQPLLNWAYYNTTDGNSYIFNGKVWEILCKGGKAGVDGLSLNWLGNFDEHPKNPKENDLYYNYVEGKTYIYSKSFWYIFSYDGSDGNTGKDGEDGEDGNDEKHISVTASDFVRNGDSLRLTFNFEGDNAFFSGTYLNPSDSAIYPYDYLQPNWSSAFSSVFDAHMHQTSGKDIEKILFKRNDGSSLYLISDTNSLYDGVIISSIMINGILGNSIAVIQEDVHNITLTENSSNHLFCSYLRDNVNNQLETIRIIDDANKETIVLDSTGEIKNFQTAITTNDELITICKDSTDNFFFITLSADGVVSDRVALPTTAKKLFCTPLPNGNICITGVEDAPFIQFISPTEVLNRIDLDTLAACYATYKPMVLNNSAIILPLEKPVSGVKYITSDLLLAKFSLNGRLEKVTEISNNSSEVFLLPLSNGNFTVFFKVAVYLNRFFFCQEFNSDLTMLSNVNLLSVTDLSFNILDVEIIESAPNQLISTYIPEPSATTVSFHRLEKSSEPAGLYLNQRSDSTAVLRNCTGQDLQLTLTAYRR